MSTDQTVEQAPADTQTLPLIDISRFRDPAHRDGLLADLRHAAHDIGFFYVVGHGVPRTSRTPFSNRHGCSSPYRSRTGSRSRTSTRRSSAATAGSEQSARPALPTSATSSTSAPSARRSPGCRRTSRTWA